MIAQVPFGPYLRSYIHVSYIENRRWVVGPNVCAFEDEELKEEHGVAKNLCRDIEKTNASKSSCHSCWDMFEEVEDCHFGRLRRKGGAMVDAEVIVESRSLDMCEDGNYGQS
jgi:hypothetical protein